MAEVTTLILCVQTMIETNILAIFVSSGSSFILLLVGRTHRQLFWEIFVGAIYALHGGHRTKHMFLTFVDRMPMLLAVQLAVLVVAEILAFDPFWFSLHLRRVESFLVFGLSLFGHF